MARLRERIVANEDPLGEIFAELRTQEERRDLGATYTPSGIVQAICETLGCQPGEILEYRPERKDEARLETNLVA